MAQEHDRDGEDHAVAHHHECGNLFGCGDEKGTGIIREDIKDGAVTPQRGDRLSRMDEIDHERLDGFLTARGRARRQLLRASSFIGALAVVPPAFPKLAPGAPPPLAAPTRAPPSNTD